MTHSSPVCSKVRFLLVSRSLPPRAGGAAVTMGNLLSLLERDEVVLLGEQVGSREPRTTMTTRHRRLSVPRLPSWRFNHYIGRWLNVPLTAAMAVWAVKRLDCQVILAVYPDDAFLLASYVAHRITKAPLLLHMHDLYAEQHFGLARQRLANWLQPRLFHHVSTVLALTAPMADFYRCRYGLEPVWLPRPVVISDDAEVAPQPAGDNFTIGVSGGIAHQNLDSLQRLAAAVKSKSGYRLRFLTPRSQQFLEAHGLWGDNVDASFASDPSELMAALRRCDVLFLGLCFDCHGLADVEMATAFPTRTYEYLVSGRPVLVHCPGHYGLANFFRTYECGLIVDQPDAQSLVCALEQLQTDDMLRERLARNALQAAEAFRGERVVERLRAALVEAVNTLDTSGGS